MNRAIIRYLVLLVWLTYPAIGAIRKVPADYPTIQAAIDACVDGDMVIVAPGTYTGEGNRDIDFKGKAITVKSVDPNDASVVAATVINCQGTEAEPHRGFQFVSGEGRNSILAGFKIINGYIRQLRFSQKLHDRAGGAIFCQGSGPMIYGCLISTNFAENRGGGIYCADADVIIAKCMIGQNTAGYAGGGIACDGGCVIIDRCMIRDNIAGSVGGGIYINGGVDSVENCLISHNLASYGGGLFCNEAADLTLNNCTVVRNIAISGLGGVHPGYSWDGNTVVLTNCILWSNWAEGQSDISAQTTVRSATLSYCCVQGWTSELDGMANFGEDPLFTSDFHLRADSPCIDAGDPNLSLVLDIDGEQRSYGGRVDVGFDEFVDTDADRLPDSWEHRYFGVVNGVEPDGNPDDDTWPNLEEYERGSNPLYPVGTLYVDATDGNDEWDGLSPVWDGWHGPKATIQAAIDQTGFLDSEYIVLAPGSYSGRGNCDIDFKGKAVTIRSQDPSDPNIVAETIIDCNGTEVDRHRGFTFVSGEGPDSVLQGLTITGGWVSDQGGAIRCIGSSPTIAWCIIRGNSAGREIEGWLPDGIYCGGGIYCDANSNPVISNCVIEDNSAGRNGGGLFSGEFSSLNLNGCTIRDNIANSGGGIYCGGMYRQQGGTIRDCLISSNCAKDGGGISSSRNEVNITNCVISNNMAIDGSTTSITEYGGGGITCHQSNPVLTNCTIVGNNTDGSGGGIACPSGGESVLLENCIVWGNSAQFGSQFSRTNCGLIVGCQDIEFRNCCIETGLNALNKDWWDAWVIDLVQSNSIDADPRFVDPDNGDFRLRPDSPCIDAGTNTPSIGLPQTDIAGNRRPQDGDKDGIAVSDIGAYETTSCDKPVIYSSTWDVEFIVKPGEPATEERILSIVDRGIGRLDPTFYCDCDWLQVATVSPNTSADETKLALSIDPSNMASGRHSCELIITDPCAINSGARVAVTLYLGGYKHVPSEFVTIQQAIDEAIPGDIIIIEDGLYQGQGNLAIDFKAKPITLRSENGPQHCILDANDEYHPYGFYFRRGEGPRSVLEGFTIRNVSVAVRCEQSHPTLKNCIITENDVGIYNTNSNLRIENCLIAHNHGDGIRLRYCFAPEVVGCVIAHNDCGIDGSDSGLIVDSCAITDNAQYGIILQSVPSVAARDGEPAPESQQHEVDIKGCTISRNRSDGISLTSCYDVRVANCTVSGNGINNQGFGIFCRQTGCDIFNCSVVGNFNGVRSSARNWPYVNVTITNSILWANREAQVTPTSNLCFINYSLVQGDWPGEGNIDFDPRFASLGYWDPNGTSDDPNDDFWVDGDYHLKSQAGRWDAVSGSWVKDDVTSPCIDAGDSNTPVGDEPFPNGGIINMGAYGGTAEASKSYFGGPVCETIVAGDINGDCKVDFADFQIMALHWLEDNSP